MGPHHSTKKGKRILLITKGGRRIVDKFVERRDSFVVLEQAGKIPVSEIRSLSDYKPYPPRAKALTLALLAGLSFTACATSAEEERAQTRARQQEDSFRHLRSGSTDASRVPPKPQQQQAQQLPPASAPQPAPPPPAPVVAPPAPKPVPQPPPTPLSTASPYLFVSPWIGKWAYQEDPNFVMELGEDGKVTYGQLFAGTFDLLDGGKVLQLKLTGQQGLVQGRSLSAVLFTIEYAEGGNVLVLRNGGNMIVMRRK